MPLYRCYLLDRDDHIRERTKSRPMPSLRLLTGRSIYYEGGPKIIQLKSGRVRSAFIRPKKHQVAEAVFKVNGGRPHPNDLLPDLRATDQNKCAGVTAPA